MAKTSGRSIKTSGGMSPKDIKYTGTLTNVRDLVTVKDPQVYKELKQAISRMESVFGLRDRSIKIADMEEGVGGAHFITAAGENAGIYLNSKYFDMKKKDLLKFKLSSYKPASKRNVYPWSTVTKNPLQHTLTHELAHGIWSRWHTSPKHKAAGKLIYSLFNEYEKNAGYRRKKGYGLYSLTNASEFFAEVMTKAVHGDPDRYTRKLKSIVKKYKL
jgi:hypothetical protein